MFCPKLTTLSSVHPLFGPTVASNFYSLWDECPTNLWTLQTFSDLANMTREDLASPVAATATSQVKLCPYDEEKPHIWFRLIEAQLAAAGIKSQKLPMPLPACPSKSFGTFLTPFMPAMTQMSRSISSCLACFHSSNVVAVGILISSNFVTKHHGAEQLCIVAILL